MEQLKQLICYANLIKFMRRILAEMKSKKARKMLIVFININILLKMSRFRKKPIDFRFCKYLKYSSNLTAIIYQR